MVDPKNALFEGKKTTICGFCQSMVPKMPDDGATCWTLSSNFERDSQETKKIPFYWPKVVFLLLRLLLIHILILVQHKKD